MKVLTINSGKSYFKVGSRDVEPQDISREDLLKILNSMLSYKLQRMLFLLIRFF